MRFNVRYTAMHGQKHTNVYKCQLLLDALGIYFKIDILFECFPR